MHLGLSFQCCQRRGLYSARVEQAFRPALQFEALILAAEVLRTKYLSGEKISHENAGLKACSTQNLQADICASFPSAAHPRSR